GFTRLLSHATLPGRLRGSGTDMGTGRGSGDSPLTTHLERLRVARSLRKLVRFLAGRLNALRQAPMRSNAYLDSSNPQRCVGSDQGLPLGSCLPATCRVPSKSSPVVQSVTIDDEHGQTGR